MEALVQRVALALVVASSSLAAQVESMGQLSPNGIVGNDQFGVRALAVDGDFAVVGVDRHDTVASNAGAAYVFERSGSNWGQDVKLTASDAGAGAEFGFAVDIDDDLIVITARRSALGGNGVGKAYVYRLVGPNWIQETTFQGSDTVSGHSFGESIAIHQPYVAVGAPDAQGSGTVYVFERLAPASWVQRAKLKADVPLVGSDFSASLSITDEHLVVGATNDVNSGFDTGAAHVFDRIGTEWVYGQRLIANDPASNDRFGGSVAIYGDYILVGASGNDDLGGSSGSAYVYRRSGTTWSQQAKLLPTGLKSGDNFGFSVDMYGDYALVGAYRDNTSSSDVGSMYLFLRNASTWVPTQQIFASDLGAGDRFGTRVAIGGNFAAATAPFYDDPSSNAGVGYAFLTNDGDCDDNGVPDVEQIASGSSLDCNGNGRPDACDLDLGVASDFNADGVPDECQPLSADAPTISMFFGGTQNLELRGDDANFAQDLYLVMGSVSGTAPGFEVQGFSIPLNYDWYTLLSASKPNAGPFVQTLGFTDGEGNAEAAITFPPGSPPLLAGMQVQHAFALVDLISEQVQLVSNTMPLDLVP